MTKILGISLSQLKTQAKTEIDSQAEKVRAKFVTVSMLSIYAEKRREAEAFLTNLELSEAETPYLSAEAEISKSTRYEVAVSIIISAYEWDQTSAKIEQIRLIQKRLIEDSVNPIDIRKATQVDWSSITSYL